MPLLWIRRSEVRPLPPQRLTSLGALNSLETVGEVVRDPVAQQLGHHYPGRPPHRELTHAARLQRLLALEDVPHANAGWHPPAQGRVAALPPGRQLRPRDEQVVPGIPRHSAQSTIARRTRSSVALRSEGEAIPGGSLPSSISRRSAAASYW